MVLYIYTGRFTFLKEKYEELIGSEWEYYWCICTLGCDELGGLDAAKQGLADLQLRQQDMHHPKLHSLVSVVDTWKMNKRNTEEKVFSFVWTYFAILTAVYIGCGGFRRGFFNSFWCHS